MYIGDIYIKPEDIMKLSGVTNRRYALRLLSGLRKEAGKGEHGLTIGDYCRVTGDDYREIYTFLRGHLPPWREGRNPAQKES